MKTDCLKSINVWPTYVASPAHARKVQAERAAGGWLEDPVKQAADKPEFQNRVLGAVGDALLQDGVDKLSRETIHGVCAPYRDEVNAAGQKAGAASKRPRKPARPSCGRDDGFELRTRFWTVVPMNNVVEGNGEMEGEATQLNELNDGMSRQGAAVVVTKVLRPGHASAQMQRRERTGSCTTFLSRDFSTVDANKLDH